MPENNNGLFAGRVSEKLMATFLLMILRMAKDFGLSCQDTKKLFSPQIIEDGFKIMDKTDSEKKKD